jgi:hypothetical protein
MKLKLASVGLFALAPLAAQAELVEMNNAELATVQGQAFTIPGVLVSRTVGVGVNSEFTSPTYDATYADVPGGVERESNFVTKYTVSPFFTYTSTGNYTGNDYRTVESGIDIDVVDVNYSRTRTFLWFNPQR